LIRCGSDVIRGFRQGQQGDPHLSAMFAGNPLIGFSTILQVGCAVGQPVELGPGYGLIAHGFLLDVWLQSYTTLGLSVSIVDFSALVVG